ncbi:MAG: 30S ribosomal protein S18 [Pseudomonadota bacterium]
MRRKFDKDKDKDKKKKKGRPLARRRICRFCADKKLSIDYKEGRLLTPFTSERGRMVPRRISGNCAKHQREIAQAIKRARILALIPFSATQVQLI